MATTPADKSLRLPPLKPHKLFFLSQISLRAFAGAATLAAAWIMLTAKQTSVVFGIQVHARYSYSPTFKFFAYTNLIVCGSTILSLLVAYKAVDPAYYFYVFVHDLMVTVLLMAGCAAATAVGYVGKYGNSHAGWVGICGYFGKFCSKATAASSISYLALVAYLILTVVSANKSRHQIGV
ncbi:CASP-like protein 1F1 [Salvia miltiorrhiza]|uniref:CASP-like protein 1F1 n=1 Tax=Salvia miltiorrhiza TaxID=226208 RepID=UPI0025AD16AD|nr:CASP-like protein 1F1 [Salvia miltiorrhiza]